MLGLFIFLVVASLLFFISKLVVSILALFKKDAYFNNKIIRGLNDYTIISYIVLVYALSISLYLAGDYTTAECNFTLIILSIATALFLAEKVYLSAKNRGQFTISSNTYDLSELAKLPEMQGVLQIVGKQEVVLLDKQKLDEMICQMPKSDSKKMLKNRLIKLCLASALSIALCIVILVVGIVRGV